MSAPAPTRGGGRGGRGSGGRGSTARGGQHGQQQHADPTAMAPPTAATGAPPPPAAAVVTGSLMAQLQSIVPSAKRAQAADSTSAATPPPPPPVLQQFAVSDVPSPQPTAAAAASGATSIAVAGSTIVAGPPPPLLALFAAASSPSTTISVGGAPIIPQHQPGGPPLYHRMGPSSPQQHGPQQPLGGIRIGGQALPPQLSVGPPPMLGPRVGGPMMHGAPPPHMAPQYQRHPQQQQHPQQRPPPPPPMMGPGAPGGIHYPAPTSAQYQHPRFQQGPPPMQHFPQHSQHPSAAQASPLPAATAADAPPPAAIGRVVDPRMHARGGRGGRGGPAAGAGPSGRGSFSSSGAPRPHAGSKRIIDESLIEEFQARYAQQQPDDDVVQHTTVGELDVDHAMSVIDGHAVTFIVTDTGTGKSTLIPKRLAELGHRVVSSQPRRTATMSLAARVAELMSEPLGENVAYRVRGERIGPDTAPVMFMTAYTLLLHVLSHPSNLGYTHFIIDEFHERQPEVEVILALLKLAQHTTHPGLKIILLSASVEVQQWRDFFEGLPVGEYSTCKTKFEIFDYHLHDICRLVGAMDTTFPITPIVESLALKNTLFVIKRLLEFLAKHTAPQHAVLVFLPGRTVVEEMKEFIEELMAETMDPIPWYRDVELDKVHSAIRRTAVSKKKVYLATDIAEVSLTLPDVVFVIDSGFTKKPRIDETNRNSVVFPPLELLYESRGAVTQRRGRVGRVQQGFYFNILAESQIPELVDLQPQIVNSRIDELSLHILQVTPNPFAMFELCRKEPKAASVHLSQNILVDSGCALPMRNPLAAAEQVQHGDCLPWTALIEDYHQKRRADAATSAQSAAAAAAEAGGGGDSPAAAAAAPSPTTAMGGYVTTVKGSLAQRLPLSIPSSLVVINGLLLGIESEAVLLASILGTGSPFYTPFDTAGVSQRRANVDLTSKAMATFAQQHTDDLLAAMIVTLKFKSVAVAGLSDEDEEEWCVAHSASRSRLHAILKLERQVRDQLAALISYVEVEDPDQLLARLEASPGRIAILVASAYLERAVVVENDAGAAQRLGRAGPSLFLGIDALRDHSVASAVPWSAGGVVIPTMLVERYKHLLGSFAVQQKLPEYLVTLLTTAFAILAESGPREGSEHRLFSTQMHSTSVFIAVENQLAEQILSFREALGARIQLMRVMLQDKLLIDDDAGLQAGLKAAGLAWVMSPTSLSARLMTGLERLLKVASAEPQSIQLVPLQQLRDRPFAPTCKSAILSRQPALSAFAPPRQ